AAAGDEADADTYGVPDDHTIILLNFQPDVYEKYRIGVPKAGTYKEVFNSDDMAYGGSGKINVRPLETKEGKTHGYDQYIEVTVPPIGGMVIAPIRDK
ncbi:MAG: alpha amylase C-terminal domain-containing protein, partial [Firmicutes bacterium]|nr:alpha amylase C-terminal domain-containing protein [Bacillota bacterium]